MDIVTLMKAKKDSVAKNQGTANAGKVMKVGADGVLYPDAGGGSGSECTILTGSESFATVGAYYAAGKDLYYKYTEQVGSTGEYYDVLIPLAYVDKEVNGNSVTYDSFTFEKTLKYRLNDGWQAVRVNVNVSSTGWSNVFVTSAEYQLGAASASSLGGVIVGDGLSVTSNGTLSVSGKENTGKITVGGTEYSVTRRALEIVDGSTTTTYYVADIT